MDVLDELDSEVQPQQSQPTGNFSPTKVAREVDAQPAHEVITRRERRWAGVIPDGLSDRTRTSLEGSLDIAHYAFRMSQTQIAHKMLEAQYEVAAKLGAEPDDPVVASRAAVRLVSEIERQALGNDGWANTSKEVENYFGKYSAVARSVGLSPQQIEAMSLDSLVRCEGDRSKAVALFAARVTEYLPERGHFGDVSFDTLVPSQEKRLLDSPEGEVESAAPDLATPDMQSAGADDPIGVYGYARDDDGTPVAMELMTAGSLSDEAIELIERGKHAEKAIAVLDQVAAEELKPVHYAVYRIMRAESYRLGQDVVGETLTQQVHEQMQYKLRSGAEQAVARVQQLLSKIDVQADLGEPSAQARARMAAPDDQIIREGIDARPKTVHRLAPKGAALE